MALTDRLFPHPGMPIIRMPLGMISSVRLSRRWKSLRPFQQPFLETFQASDLAEIGPVGNILNEAAAIDQEPLFLEQGRQRLSSKTAVHGLRTAPMR